MKMQAATLCESAKRFGVTLAPRGDKLRLIPAGRCPPELKELLSKHKREVLDYLEASGAGLRRDERPWFHIAKQVLAGEFDRACKPLRKTLVIGLRSIRHPLCQRALEKLEGVNNP